MTFDEFLTIPPCTTGKHSTIDDTPAQEAKPAVTEENIPPPPRPISTRSVQPPAASPQSQPTVVPAPAPPESDSDEPSAALPPNTTCKRRGCNMDSSACKESREDENCIYHPGQAIFVRPIPDFTYCPQPFADTNPSMKVPKAGPAANAASSSLTSS